MRKKGITRTDILFLSISFFAIVFVWVASNVFHEWVTTTISEDLQLQIIPIAPKFDTATIDKLKERQRVDPLFNLVETPVASAPAEETETPTEEVITIPEEGQPEEEVIIIEEEPPTP